MKNSDSFHISAQNRDLGYLLQPPRQGGSNEYPQSMFLAEIRKLIYTPHYENTPIQMYRKFYLQKHKIFG